LDDSHNGWFFVLVRHHTAALTCRYRCSRSPDFSFLSSPTQAQRSVGLIALRAFCPSGAVQGS
jgi:hypothetical protein